MDALARREHSRSELAEKLLGAGFDPDTATATLDTLVADGLQSDQRFVESFISSFVRRGKGPLRIRHELGRRGVDEALCDDALREAAVDWKAQARAVRLKKFGGSDVEDFKDRARQMRFLQYRGFTGEQISASFDVPRV